MFKRALDGSTMRDWIKTRSYWKGWLHCGIFCFIAILIFGYWLIEWQERYCGWTIETTRANGSTQVLFCQEKWCGADEAPWTYHVLDRKRAPELP